MRCARVGGDAHGNPGTLPYRWQQHRTGCLPACPPASVDPFGGGCLNYRRLRGGVGQVAQHAGGSSPAHQRQPSPLPRDRCLPADGCGATAGKPPPPPPPPPQAPPPDEALPSTDRTDSRTIAAPREHTQKVVARPKHIPAVWPARYCLGRPGRVGAPLITQPSSSIPPFLSPPPRLSPIEQP